MRDLSVVVINLARRRDRWRELVRRWAGTTEARRPLLRVDAVDDPGDPHRGCLASHLAVLRAYAGPLLVLEDDACFDPAFTLDLTPPPGWGVAWLGGQHKAPPTPAGPGWVRPVHLLRSHAYLVADPAGYAALLTHVPRVDPYFARAPLPQYAQQPFTVGQAAGRSDTTAAVRPAAEFWLWPPRRGAAIRRPPF